MTVLGGKLSLHPQRKNKILFRGLFDSESGNRRPYRKKEKPRPTAPKKSNTVIRGKSRAGHCCYCWDCMKVAKMIKPSTCSWHTTRCNAWMQKMLKSITKGTRLKWGRLRMNFVIAAWWASRALPCSVFSLLTRLSHRRRTNILRKCR